MKLKGLVAMGDPVSVPVVLLGLLVVPTALGTWDTLLDQFTDEDAYLDSREDINHPRHPPTKPPLLFLIFLLMTLRVHAPLRISLISRRTPIHLPVRLQRNRVVISERVSVMIRRAIALVSLPLTRSTVVPRIVVAGWCWLTRRVLVTTRRVIVSTVEGAVKGTRYRGYGLCRMCAGRGW